MSKSDSQKLIESGLIIGMQLSGDKSEIHRKAIIQDLLSIGQTISLNATWDQIDTVITRLYVSGTLLRASSLIHYVEVRTGRNISLSNIIGQNVPIPKVINVSIPFRDIKSYANVVTAPVVLLTTVAQEQNFDMSDGIGYTFDACMVFDGTLHMKNSSGAIQSFSLYSHELDGDIYAINIDNHNVSSYSSVTISNIDNIPSDTALGLTISDAGNYFIESFSNVNAGINLVFADSLYANASIMDTGHVAELSLNYNNYSQILSVF